MGMPEFLSGMEYGKETVSRGRYRTASEPIGSPAARVWTVVYAEALLTAVILTGKPSPPVTRFQRDKR